MDVASSRSVSEMLGRISSSSVEESSFCVMRELEVWCGTFNVNGKKEKAIALSWWLMQGWTERAPHVFCISLQEMIDLSAANVVKEAIVDTTSKNASEEWASELKRAFGYVTAARPGCWGSRGAPQLVGKEHMVGIAIFLFASPPADDVGRAVSVEDVDTAKLPTGAAGGRLGNKGACALRCRARSTSICFVGAHLSAHRGDVEGRNGDYHAIVSQDCFSAKPNWGGGGASDESSASSSKQAGAGAGDSNSAVRNPCGTSFGVLQHDVVFFLGDLNYRIVKDVPDTEVHYLVRSNLRKLVTLDQLVVERAARRVFEHGFEEAPLTFLPTYKYVVGSALYDYEATPPSGKDGAAKKVRCPAWCDRVLWRVRPTGPRPSEPRFSEAVTCLTYDRAEDRLSVSDHRPVHASFRLALRDVDAPKRVAAGAHATETARLSAEGAPKTTLTLDPPYFWLKAGVDASAALRNVGPSPATARFADVPRWLDVTPKSDVLMPGDETVFTLKADLTDDQTLAALAANGGLLGTTLKVVVEDRRGPVRVLVAPATLTSAPGWPYPIAKQARDPHRPGPNATSPPKTRPASVRHPSFRQ